MNWPGFYVIERGWFFLLLVPLIALYFLKLKRPHLQVASLYLWRQVIDDQRVNSPFQKFKRNLLLLLQLLLLTMLVLGAMQPFIQSGPDRAKYLPVLIDCSASMAALDKPNGESRLAIAKREVGTFIDNLLPDQQMALVAVHSTGQRLTEFTNNKRILHAALDRLQVEDVPSRLEDGLRLTQALSRTYPIENVLFFSDGNLPAAPRKTQEDGEESDDPSVAVVDFELPFDLNFQVLPHAGPNLGITALNARRSRDSRWEVFVRVSSWESTGDEETKSASARIELLQDGQLAADDTIVLDEGDSRRLAFRLSAEGRSSLEVRLIPDEFDSLETDNRAYLELPEPRELRVYCDPELVAFRHALRNRDDLILHPVDPENPAPPDAEYDVSVLGNGEFVDASIVVTIGKRPEDLAELVTVAVETSRVVDWERTDPLLQHVQLSQVELADTPRVATGISDGDFEDRGYEILAHGVEGPLIVRRRTPARLEVAFLFDTDHSTLPYRVAFPVMVSNLVQMGLAEASLADVNAPRTPVLPHIVVAGETSVTVRDPGGEATDFTTGPEGLLSGVPAFKVGRYQVEPDDGEASQIGVSLLNHSESSLAAVSEIKFRELSVGAAATPLKSDRPLWPLLAIIAFVVLLAEWWYFQRPRGQPT